MQFFYIETKESIHLGSRTILHLGMQVRDAFNRGVTSSKLAIYRPALIQLFGQDTVDLPDIVLKTIGLPCTAGPGKRNPFVYQLDLAYLPGQAVEEFSTVLRADSLDHHRHSNLQESLVQGAAFELFASLTSSMAHESESIFRRRAMHVHKTSRGINYMEWTTLAAARAKAKNAGKEDFCRFVPGRLHTCRLHATVRLSTKSTSFSKLSH